jgi:SurA N-terminal domain/PPIC-type PPIASE domain
MIGSIRKHSAWLWWLIAGLTIISFVVFMGSGPARNGNGGSSAGSFGTIYGRTITAQDYQSARATFYLYFWMRNGQWPDKAAGFNRDEMDREVYVRLLIQEKGRKLGIAVGEDALVNAANDLLRSLGRNGQAVTMDKFATQVLAPEGLGVNDLQNFLRDEIVVQQLIQVYGLSGLLVTPQEAGQLYDREHQEVSSQAVFFTASNYLAQVAVTPAAVSDFYNKNLAVYREPDRVQVSYVFFNVTNYLAQAKAEFTNLTEYVNAVYQQYGASQFPNAKTPDEAKAQIRELVVRDRALKDARTQANDFANAVFAMTPAKPENLAAYAKQKGVASGVTAPFAANYGPMDLNAPASFTKAAFGLSADEPFAGPIVAADGIYVIALANQLPSVIPSLDQIKDRVTEDFREREAVALAQRAGTNFYYQAAVQMAAGGTFAKAAVAAGQSPQALPGFSIATEELPELGERASLNQVKQAAFTTQPGHLSQFQATADGGFVLFVQSVLPLDTSRKTAELPQFTLQVRRARQNEAFNLWLQGEANRELRNTPFFAKMTASGAAK